MKYDLVQIVWKDAGAGDGGWLPIEEAVKEDLYEVVSVGFRIYEDKKRIMLAATLSRDVCNDTCNIPKPLIVSKTVLKRNAYEG